MSERLTMEEWQRRQAEVDCARHGHDYEHIVNMAGELLRLVCARCGRAWGVIEL